METKWQVYELVGSSRPDEIITKIFCNNKAFNSYHKVYQELLRALEYEKSIGYRPDRRIGFEIKKVLLVG